MKCSTVIAVSHQRYPDSGTPRVWLVEVNGDRPGRLAELSWQQWPQQPCYPAATIVAIAMPIFRSSFPDIVHQSSNVAKCAKRQDAWYESSVKRRERFF